MIHVLFFFACLCTAILSANPADIVSTESDPDAFIQGCVNVINGRYCEAATDLSIDGPDPLILQRFYTNKGWTIYPQRFLVIGKDTNGKSCTIGKDRFYRSVAFIGERSGGILPYAGWRNVHGITKDPLKIDILNVAHGIVNTYAKEIKGQTNLQNNLLDCKGDTCELVLGDGTKRSYKRVETMPSLLLGEEFIQSMSAEVVEPDYFLLTEEILPSGNRIYFSYDADDNHLIAIEMKNKNSSKTLSWIHISYQFDEKGCTAELKTSDSRSLTYQFVLNETNYQLTQINGTHCFPITYEYNGKQLVRKILPEKRFVEVVYENEKVIALKGPNADSGNPETVYSFSYGNGFTDAFDALGVKTRYFYDKRFQLVSIEYHNAENTLERIESKFWGQRKGNAGLLLAKTISDGTGRICSYRCFQYDQAGNVIEEKLYGNLTGKKEVSLKVSVDGELINPDEEECHRKTFDYSCDGLNLLIKMGDCKECKTLYTYQPGTNLLIKKLIYEKWNIKKRTFQHYNEDGVCIKIVDDDGDGEKENDLYKVTERHIREIKPKACLPCVGLPEIIEEKALNQGTGKEILIRKYVNNYDDQGNLLSCDTYDSNDKYAFTERRTYNSTGQVTYQSDAIGRETTYFYDGVGNQISCVTPYQNKQINTIYDFHNKPIQITEINAEETVTLYNTFDILGRKTSSTDRFGNSTYYEYDAFHRLTKVIHPEVLDEKGQKTHPTFRYTYDIFGNVLTTIDPKGFVTTKSYNLRGSPTKISYPDGSLELFKYDTEGSLHRSLTRDQIITVYEYDSLGRPCHEEMSTANETGVYSFLRDQHYQYNGFRCIWEHNKSNSLIKSYKFDAAGRLSSIVECKEYQEETNKDAKVTKLFYDSFGRIQKRQVWFGVGPNDYSVECLAYDLAGNIIEKRMESAQGDVLLQKHYSYNLQDQCIEEFSIENGRKTVLTSTSYNAQGDPIASIDGLGQETKIIIDNAHQNALGQTVLKKTIVNPLGMHAEMEFDALGRICTICKKNSFGVLLSSQRNLYDTLGNKTCEINDRIIGGEIVDSQKTEWVYGPMGRLEEMRQAAGTPLETSTHFEYNSLGKLVRKKRAGQKGCIEYKYHKDGNLQKIEAQDNKQELQISNTYAYDSRGNITEANSLNGININRTFNLFNQLTLEKINDGLGTYILEYAYDKKGRLKEILLPDQSKIAYVYDAVFGREVRRLSAQGKELYTHTYDDYDLQGRLLRENHIGYVGSNEYQYDLNGKKTINQNDFYPEEYVRDPLGHILEIKGEDVKKYTYNELSQLTAEMKSTVKTYAYDSLHNRIQKDNEELVYNSLNQLTAHSKGEFSYDLQGNLLRKVNDGKEINFESNLLSQLVSINKEDKTSLAFFYDPFGRLLVEKHFEINGKNKKALSTKRYLYLGYQEIGSLSSTGTFETLKIPGLKGDELAPTSIAFEIKGELYGAMHDIAGNVVCLIDPYEHQIVESYHYSAFGETTIFNADGEQQKISRVGNPWQFAEKRVDEELGLIRFGLRFYDPVIGRWISQDPAGYTDGPNLYAYLHNNPLGNLDRFGLAAEDNSQTKFDEYFYGEYETHCFCERHRTCKRGGDISKTLGNTLPKMTYDDNFESLFIESYDKQKFDFSSCYDLEGALELPNDLGIGFINGIWNDFEGFKESMGYLSKLSGGYNIRGVCNATHGKDPDLFECKLGLNYIATSPVRQLHKMWNSFFEKSSADAKFLMICHSQGAIHTRNALLDYPPGLRERIIVLAIAPGAYIYEETCSKVLHYRAEWWRDFVPRIDWAGAKRLEDTIITLRSHQNASKFDHEFMSHTYKKALKRQIAYFIQTRGKIL